MKWAYGVTTVPSRISELLPRTLDSLKSAGFVSPRLFVDGVENNEQYKYLGLETTCRFPNVRTYGNWVLSLFELYIRNPIAHRYAIFQDDFITYKNLKQYLESCELPDKGYWNLYTYPQNQEIAPNHKGWFPSNQMGLGALGLVFNQEGVTTLLNHFDIITHPSHAHWGHKKVDGAVVTALKKGGWIEYVHNPSLVQHTGYPSSMGHSRQAMADCFLGEEFDATELIENSV